MKHSEYSHMNTRLRGGMSIQYYWAPWVMAMRVWQLYLWEHLQFLFQHPIHASKLHILHVINYRATLEIASICTSDRSIGQLTHLHRACFVSFHNFEDFNHCWDKLRKQKVQQGKATTWCWCLKSFGFSYFSYIRSFVEYYYIVI